MSDIDDLPVQSILDMSDAELHEHLRQIRHSRRTVSERPKKKSKVKQQASRSQTKAAIKQDKNALLDMIALLEGELEE